MELAGVHLQPNVHLPKMSEARTVSFRKTTDMMALAGKWRKNVLLDI